MYNINFGKCYYVLSDQERTWNDANSRCAYIDGRATLTSIGSEDENNYVVDLMSQTSWIGGIIDNEMNTGKWADGSLFTYFTKWNRGEPNYRGNESCVLTYARYTGVFAGYWNDEPCNLDEFRFHAVCSIVLTTTNTTTTTSESF